MAKESTMSLKSPSQRKSSENSEVRRCQVYANVREKEGNALALSTRSLLLGRNDNQGLPVADFRLL